MKKVLTLTTIAMVIAPTFALAQTQTAKPASPTIALVNMVVAEQFCRIAAPTELTRAMGDEASKETGLDMPQLVDATYIAAGEIGRHHQTNGTLANFCIRMAQIYLGVY